MFKEIKLVSEEQLNSFIKLKEEYKNSYKSPDRYKIKLAYQKIEKDLIEFFKENPIMKYKGYVLVFGNNMFKDRLYEYIMVYTERSYQNAQNYIK